MQQYVMNGKCLQLSTLHSGFSSCGLCEIKLKIHLKVLIRLVRADITSCHHHHVQSVSLLSSSVLVLYSLFCVHLCMWTAYSIFMLMVQVFWADGCPDIFKCPWQYWGTTFEISELLTQWHKVTYQKTSVCSNTRVRPSQLTGLCCLCVTCGHLWHWSFYQILVTGGCRTSVCGLIPVSDTRHIWGQMAIVVTQIFHMSV
jgi:hypothetical protein